MKKFRHPETGETVFASESTAARLTENADEGKSLADMTKAELAEYAAANEIEVDSKANKGDILEAIEAAENADEG